MDANNYGRFKSYQEHLFCMVELLVNSCFIFLIIIIFFLSLSLFLILLRHNSSKIFKDDVGMRNMRKRTETGLANTINGHQKTHKISHLLIFHIFSIIIITVVAAWNFQNKPFYDE
jgi:hypothetical protein